MIFSTAIEENQAIETTIRLSKLIMNAPHTRKAERGVKRFKKAIQNHFRSDEKVVITRELNLYMWSRGPHKMPRKVRVRVTKDVDNDDAEKSVLKCDLVVVGSFKGLKDIVIDK
jgi:large subunit ribosomal protein L31e